VRLRRGLARLRQTSMGSQGWDSVTFVRSGQPSD
jgi:hypothetical protein